MKFKGKIGLWWYLILLIYNLFFLWCIIKHEQLSGFLICVILLTIFDVFLILLTLRTYVIVEDKNLIIVLGLAEKKIDCNKISSVRKSSNPIASMALSFDRIRLSYGNECTYISVRNNDELIRKLKKINPDIQLN